VQFTLPISLLLPNFTWSLDFLLPLISAKLFIFEMTVVLSSAQMRRLGLFDCLTFNADFVILTSTSALTFVSDQHRAKSGLL
jgi:hypothetical protein